MTLPCVEAQAGDDARKRSLRDASATGSWVVPFVASPDPVVDRMLELCGVAAEDLVYDLGCGDGRIVVAAVRRFGARGVCVEIDPELVRRARENALAAGAGDRIEFVQGDLYRVDLRPATVVALYLNREMNLFLRPKLFRELTPGTRIVSHEFAMGAWEPDATARVPGDDERHVHLWKLPAAAGGDWRFEAPWARAGEGESVLRIHQRFQQIDVKLIGPEGTLIPASDARLSGAHIEIELPSARPDASKPVRLEGTIEGNMLRGEIRMPGGLQPEQSRWRAERRPVQVQGTWTWTGTATLARLVIEERNGWLRARHGEGRRTRAVEDLYVWGGSLYFTLGSPEAHHRAFSGLIRGDRIEGEWRDADGAAHAWAADRLRR